MSILGKILIKIFVSLVLIFQIVYILNVFLTIKYKIEMMKFRRRYTHYNL